MIRVRFQIIVLLVFVLISSCVSNTKIAYLQFDEIDQGMVSNKFETIFKPDDLLKITISSLDTEATRPFNLTAASSGSSEGGASSGGQQLYLIDSKGVIDFPVLGKLKLGGLTREAALQLLKSKLSPDYIKNPTININITNFKITVYGAVNSSGTFTIPNERVSILDAIGMAGDLKMSGRRDNIMVLREENNKKIKYNVNLLSNKTLSSPVFYLQQNDVVYVEHNAASIQKANSNEKVGLFISIIGILVTVATFILR